jgi:hypothetical protein
MDWVLGIIGIISFVVIGAFVIWLIVDAINSL